MDACGKHARKRPFTSRWARTWAIARATLAGAEEAMNAAGIRVLRTSSLYITEPVDAPPPWFLNAVVEAETELMPRQLLHAIAGIERQLGRRRMSVGGPRTLDLDILLYGTSVIRAAELEVPHPRLPYRRFVLVPLVELVPALRHPVLRKSMAELLAETPDSGQVRRWQPAGDRLDAQGERNRVGLNCRRDGGLKPIGIESSFSFCVVFRRPLAARTR